MKFSSISFVSLSMSSAIIGAMDWKYSCSPPFQTNAVVLLIGWEHGSSKLWILHVWHEGKYIYDNWDDVCYVSPFFKIVEHDLKQSLCILMPKCKSRISQDINIYLEDTWNFKVIKLLLKLLIQSLQLSHTLYMKLWRAIILKLNIGLGNRRNIVQCAETLVDSQSVC